MQTSNKQISALESQVASKDAEIAAEVAQVDGLEGCVRIAEERMSQISLIIHKLGLQLHAAEAARSCTQGAFRSVEC